MKARVYEYLRDVLCPNGRRGNVHYNEVCKALGDITPLEVVALLRLLKDEGKIDTYTSTYAAYVVLK